MDEERNPGQGPRRLERISRFVGSNLARMAAPCLVGSTTAAFLSSLSDGLGTAITDGLGWGIYFGGLLWLLMVPGALIYLLILSFWSSRGSLRVSAVVLSPLLAGLPAWAFIDGGVDNRSAVLSWTIGVAIAFGFLVKVPRARPTRVTLVAE